ncbi:MAG TPA: hypothetical protein PKD98_04730 [Anaerolineae bacterium]|nr:hypothetical protein [Anaerolineae bacterium]
MLSPEVNQRVVHEQHKDRLRKSKHNRRVAELEQQTASITVKERKVVHQLGNLMIRWGTKLQSL